MIGGRKIKREEKKALINLIVSGDTEQLYTLIGTEEQDPTQLKKLDLVNHDEMVKLAFLGYKSKPAPFMEVVRNGHKRMAGMLLPLAIRYQSRGGSLDFDKFDKDGLNALMYAVVGGYIQIVRLLLIAGCDPRIMYVPKKAMMLPRSIVQLANDNNHPDIAEMLIEAIQEKEISEREKQGRQKKTNRSMLFYNKPSDFGQTVQPKKSRRSRNK